MRASAVGFILALAMAPYANSAGVIAGNGPWAVATSAHPTSHVDVDIDGDGQAELEAYADIVSSFGLVTSVDCGVRPASGSAFQFTRNPRQTRTLVDDSLSFGSGELGLYEAPGDGVRSLIGTFGFRFTSGGATHYGWADVSVTGGFDPASPPAPDASGRVVRWAYESDPNTPITTGAVPEPASAALLVAVAPVLLRRRRNRSTASSSAVAE